MSGADNQLAVIFCPTGRGTNGTVVLRRGDETLKSNTLNIGKAAAREDFANEAAAEFKGLDAKVIKKELLNLAGKHVIEKGATPRPATDGHHHR